MVTVLLVVDKSVHLGYCNYML